MKILITGCDGYIGWPLFLKLIIKYPKFKILGVDNLSRRKWTSKKSNIRISSMNSRLNEVKRKFNRKNFKFQKLDLLHKNKVKNLLKNFKPDVILHLAAQPSAPYANKNINQAIFTNINNSISTLNLLWSLKENNLLKCKFIETTTTGVYGTPETSIPEGFLKKGKEKKIPFASMGGSWYHISKSNDCNFLWLANKLWGLTIIDFRTAITLGVQTEETKISKYFNTRFDSDFFFGVVANKFIKKALNNEEIEVYGKGKQKKPFIDLEDAVESIDNSIKLKIDNKYHVYNQLSETISINQISKMIKQIYPSTKIKHIKNPRIEKEEHNMKMDNKKFLKILKKKPKKILRSIKDTFQNLN